MHSGKKIILILFFLAVLLLILLPMNKKQDQTEGITDFNFKLFLHMMDFNDPMLHFLNYRRTVSREEFENALLREQHAQDVLSYLKQKLEGENESGKNP